MDSAELLRDLELIPETLPLALNATNIAAIAPAPHVGRWVFVGMGSSRFAAGAIAAQLRAIGVDASAEYASADLLPATGAGTALVAISAGGTSLETLDSFARAAPGTYRIAVTNRAGSPITAHADAVVDMLAGEERSGVACRSYVQTLAVLLGLAAPLGLDIDPARTIDHAVAAARELLATRAHWLPPVLDALAGGDGTWLLAPSERLASAEQGALMIRECPRRMADACETGDWSHVDVYLTKTLAYRAI
ncbi:MAG TPA: SIS domain-containing protein, partial [Ilumatobacteraceae bacterium]